MPSYRTILIAAIAIGFPTIAAAQVETFAGDPKLAKHHSDWPLAWIEGAWKVESIQQTCNGEHSDKKFAFSDYILFTSGYRFALYEPHRLTSAPMIGHSEHRGSLHCLFKMTRNRAAMQTRFTQHEDYIEYCTYLIMPEEGRFRFKRRLVRVANEVEFAGLLQAAVEEAVNPLDSADAEGVIEAWTKKHRALVTNN